MKIHRAACLFALAICSLSPVVAAVRLPAIISEHMVLARTPATRVWGWANPHERVEVAVAGVAASAVADAGGRWELALDLANAGAGPFVLKVRGENELEVEDVLVGEVWLAGGQSNMEFPLSRSAGAAAEVAGAADAQFRHFRVGRAAADTPQEDCRGRWVVASPETAGDFTAVGYYFGKRLRRELGVPVGIVCSSWGGTHIEAWTSRAALAADPELGPSAARLLKTIVAFPEEIAAWRAAMRVWLKDHGRDVDADAADPLRELAALPTADADWEPVQLPGRIDAKFLPDGGVAWLRRKIDVPAKMAGSRLTLRLGRIDGYETVFWNGSLVDRTTIANTAGEDYRRTFLVPANLVTAGENVLLLRVHVPAGRLAIPYELRAGMLPLKGRWDLQVAKKYDALAKHDSPPALTRALPAPEHRPGNLHNGMISPVARQTIRGVIWYQGEANAGRAAQYRRALPLLIEDWRRGRGRPDLPFYICQLANHFPKENRPSESAWAELREAQALTAATVPGCGLAVLIDSGEAADIHPIDKAVVGERLARIALARDYARDIVWSGPVYRSMRVEGRVARLAFDHAHAGLVARPLPASYAVRAGAGERAPLVRNSSGSELEGFAICGANREWVWARARIEGDEVVVWNDAVPEPVAVRYNWADNPDGNLYNEAGLPAVPFRTDDFPMLTRDRAY